MRPHRQRFPLILSIVVASLAVMLLLRERNHLVSGQGPVSPKQQDLVSKSAKGATDVSALSLQLEDFASGLLAPVGIANSGDLRLFVLEKDGRIRIVQPNGHVETTPFLDIRDRVDSSSFEEGLLGMAFHPGYHENGYFYLNYTNTTADIRRTRISRFMVSPNPNIADATSEEILLTVIQPHPNHNAGNIAFGPDGFLYIPLGDGGSGGDPDNYAQDVSSLLGKISRIDVDSSHGSAPDCAGLGSGNYTIPVSNPINDGPGGACDEIWASGLRNPWQSTFDSLTGDLFVADVGQAKVEEVNFQAAASTGGENYGWRCYEGSSEYNTVGCNDRDAYTFPIFEYTRPSAFGDCSVTGGYVYRGSIFQAMVGRYFLTDYCSGRFWDLQQLPNGTWQSTGHNDVFPPGDSTTVGNSAFGERCDGELYVANVNNGKLYHLTTETNTSVQSQSEPKGSRIEADRLTYLPLLTISACR